MNKQQTRKTPCSSKAMEKLIENFHTEWRNGYTLKEIAEKYGADRSSVYKRLEEIAKRNGVSRDYYSERNRKSSKIVRHSNSVDEYENSICQLDELFSKILADVRGTKNIISQIQKMYTACNTNKEEE